MNKQTVIEALKHGVRWDDGLYDSWHRYFEFHDDGTIRLECYATEGDEVSGNDIFERSTATIAANPVRDAIGQALRTGVGRIECPITLFQNPYGRDQYREFNERCQTVVNLSVRIECHQPYSTVAG